MIGVIGCGNMAQAIVKGYYKNNNSVEFLTYTPSFTRADELAREVNGAAAKELGELKRADSIVIACKPQQLDSLCESIKSAGLDLSHKHIISILAATPIESLKLKLAVSQVTRVMPNTPSLVGKGMSLLIHSIEVTDQQKDLVSDFFTSCGEVALMPNELTFDQVTTVSGSGPAYVFLFAQTMADKLVSWGVAEDEAKKIVIQLFCGSSELMKDQSENTLSELVDKVTSKGGVTIEAVKSYQADKLDQITSKALDAAFKRSEEMRENL